MQGRLSALRQASGNCDISTILDFRYALINFKKTNHLLKKIKCLTEA
jgi:hypothetical protein